MRCAKGAASRLMLPLSVVRSLLFVSRLHRFNRHEIIELYEIHQLI
jgi:hypothetical protein